MSDVGPFGKGGPFEDLVRNLAQMLTSQGPVNWDIARQLASWTASGGETEPNPDPVARMKIEELCRIALMHVEQATGLEASSHGALQAHTVSRSEWALRSLEAWRPLLTALAGSMTGPPSAPAGAVPPDPMSQLLGNLPQVLGPLLFGMQSGAMVGQLAQRAMGQYDLPMPRPPAGELLFVTATIDQFAEEWSLSPDDVRMWVCLREVTHHAVLGQAHVRNRLDACIRAYIDAFEPDQQAIEERLGMLDPTDMEAMQAMFGDPTALLGDLQSDEQRRLQVPLQALLSALAGYVDHVMDTVGRRLVGGYEPITEALRRRRLEEHPGSRLLGQLFGVELDGAAYERGQAFVHGILERAGDAGLRRLWQSEAELPTPAEVDAPGLWLARIDLPAG